MQQLGVTAQYDPSTQTFTQKVRTLVLVPVCVGVWVCGWVGVCVCVCVGGWVWVFLDLCLCVLGSFHSLIP